MKELQVFRTEAFLLRSVEKDGEPWFLASDVCKALDLGPELVRRLDDDEYTLISTQGIHGAKNPQMNIVSEAGLYSLVLGSRKPEAKAFKRWVTHEVLPSIRKTGTFSVRVPATFADALQLAADQARELEAIRPRAMVADRISDATNHVNIGTFAKSAGEGPIKIFKKLEALKILFKGDANDWTPYQQFIDQGYFKTIVNPINHGSRIVNHTTTYVTGKGEVWLTKKLQEGA